MCDSQQDIEQTQGTRTSIQNINRHNLHQDRGPTVGNEEDYKNKKSKNRNDKQDTPKCPKPIVGRRLH